MRSDGAIHEKNAIGCLVLLAVGAVALMLLTEIPLGLGTLLGGMLGLFIDPDLDHRGTTRAENRMYRVWKPLGVLFSMYWTPYQAVFKHGSELSHGGPLPLGWLIMVVVATPIRILYSFLWMIPLIIRVSWLRDWLFGVSPLFWLGMYLGWAAQDGVHWSRDFLLD